MKSLEN